MYIYIHILFDLVNLIRAVGLYQFNICRFRFQIPLPASPLSLSLCFSRPPPPSSIHPFSLLGPTSPLSLSTFLFLPSDNIGHVTFRARAHTHTHIDTRARAHTHTHTHILTHTLTHSHAHSHRRAGLSTGFKWCCQNNVILDSRIRT